jgi:glycosyltransferase involved in cell wall biosynthesis
MSKIVVLAYGCEPMKGSEQGVGWNWVWQLGVKNDVYVITRKNNRESIDQYLKENKNDNLHFEYYDLPKYLKWWKKGERGLHLYYAFWNFGAVKVAKKIVKINKIDICVDFKFGNLFLPSFIYKLKLPTILGPMGAAVKPLKKFTNRYPVKQRLFFTIKPILQRILASLPNFNKNLKQSKTIILHSNEILHLIPPNELTKCVVIMHNGVSIDFENKEFKEKNEKIRHFVYTGRLNEAKEVELIIRAYYETGLIREGSKLYIVGEGKTKEKLRLLVEKLGISNGVLFVGKVSMNEVKNSLSRAHVFVSASISEISSTSMMEAMALGLPVICLNLSGNRMIVDNNCGILLEASTPYGVINEMSEAMRKVVDDSILFNKLSSNAKKKAYTEFRWENKQAFIGNMLEKALQGGKV